MIPANTEIASRTSAKGGLKIARIALVPRKTTAAEQNGSTTRTTRSTMPSTSAVIRTSRSP